MPSLKPYQYRPATPNNDEHPSPNYDSGNSHNSPASKFSIWSSPGSPKSRATTPSNSPILIPSGPTLLPRIRTRDQGLDQDVFTSKSHRRAFSTNFNPPNQPVPSRPGFQRSTTSPPQCSSVLTPVSTTSTVDTWAETSAINSPVPFSSSLTGRSLGHARSTSTPAVDFASLRRYGNPNYRTRPVYLTQKSQYSNVVLQSLPDFASPEFYVPASTGYRDLTPELCLDGPTTTVMEYLTGPNPAVAVVDKVSIGLGHHMHCWWDIRNLENWEDFNLDTIKAIPNFSPSEESSGLLNVPIPSAALPKPHGNQPVVQPSNERALQDVITTFYAAKINAALKTCQGHQHYITIVPQRNKEDGPFYLSAYANDETHALGRGRIVGLVKTYNYWNSSMGKEKNNKQNLYLSGLSHLHRLMRESNTRYGFIITEIELVCVRMGTEQGKPYFGFLELSNAITLSEQTGLTPCLALWYLHMLAGDAPLEGQCGYRIDLGPPHPPPGGGPLSRMHVRKPGLQGRDAWMQRVQESERRSARRARGWAFPEDPWSKKEREATKGVPGRR
ncbi:MAG: hypothetical protein ASARMPREDX12_003795 [Alectoria sarmentosa]|nr:MAG: hypothetical protein ASARMPREDX12_003795 [Alectoria sarmentosa]CAD6571919.1 MAG: hypothetical protein ASARMPRED_004917 [Alectoria sarmentosa]